MSDLMSEARARTRPDLIYQSLYSAAIGGSIVALFFLVIDAWNGRPLFTPSLLGGVLFGGVGAASDLPVNLDWVAFATVLHFIAFAAVGTGVTLLAHAVELRSRHPGTVLFWVFLALEWSFCVAAWVVLPGVLEVLGFWRVFVANLLAAGGIVVFLWASHQPKAWEQLKQAAHLT